MKMNRIFPLLASAVFVSGTLFGQEGALTSRGALDMIAQRFGPESVEWIVELRGEKGVPQPEEWELMAFNKRAPRLLHWFSVNDRRVKDEGEDEEYYPKRPPLGYVSINDVRVDSKAAFTIAEAEASKAQMGFDSLNYLLRIREFSREPIWRVELIDADRMLVGQVYISAENGEVLRTIWIFRDERARPDGLPLIIDSAAPREGMQTRITSNRNMSGSNGELEGARRPVEPQLDQIPIPTDDLQPARRMVEQGPPPAPIEPAPVDDPAARVRDMRKTAPQGEPENPIFKKPTSKGGVDTRIPPPPIPPSGN